MTDWTERWQSALMDNYGTPPLALAEGDGALVTDVDGRTYLDLLGGIAVGSAGVALIALLYGESGLGGRWAGVGVILTLMVVALSMWACGEVASASPKHPRTSLVSLGANLAVILTLVAMALVVLAMMSVLKGGLVSWISSVAVALISANATIAALSARAIVGAVILARETAEIGPEIEPVSGP